MQNITIEKLLTWAFVDELPKGGGAEGIYSPKSAWSLMDYIASFGVRVDIDRGRQDLPGRFEQGEPHPDAILVGEAVRELANHNFDMADLSFEKLPLYDWTDEAKALAKPIFENVLIKFQNRPIATRQQSLIALVVSCAVLEKKPSRKLPVPNVSVVSNGNTPLWFIKRKRVNSFGHEIEVEIDGYNYRSHRPYKGAYKKQFLTPSPENSFLGWFDFWLWKKALTFLKKNLSGKLSDYRVILS